MKFIVFNVTILLSFLLGLSQAAYSQQSDTSSFNKNAGLPLLYINSIPEGATVYRNSKPYGKTPLEIFNLDGKRFEFSLVKEGYKPWDFAFDLPLSERHDVIAILDGTYGLLQISSEPQGAEVYVGDSFAGLTPLLSYKVPVGAVNIKLRKRGYKDWLLNTVMMSRLISHDIKLESNYSGISFEKAENLSSIKIDDKLISKSTGNEWAILSGMHTIEAYDQIKKKSFTRSIDMKPGLAYKFSSNSNTINLKPFLTSLYLPGVGQYRNGSTTKGLILMSSSIASCAMTVFGFVDYSTKKKDYDRLYDIYKNTKNEFEIAYNKKQAEQAHNKANNAQKLKSISLGVFIGAYLFNLADALIWESKEYIRVVPNSVGIENLPLISAPANDVKVELNVPVN